MFFPSFSSPASMQALSNSCLITRLASSGEAFLYSFSFTINSLLLSNSKVKFLNYILGFPLFDCYSIIDFMKAICLIPLEIGLITNAGPRTSLLETTTLSTYGCNSFLTHKENEVRSSAGTEAYSFLSYFLSFYCYFTPLRTR